VNALSPGDRLAEAAQALVGSRFRLHGRDPVTGLDCVGVLAAALKAIGREAPLPGAYRLRSRAIPGLAGIAGKCGLTVVEGTVEPGDVQLVRIGACQFHVVIAARDGRFIHAHAGLGRVVMGPPGDDWRVTDHWRLIPKN
jgi:cell wall-associated NlpC family hydrolase